MSINISKKLSVELTDTLQENATDFFHKKELIGYFVSYEDLLNEPEFEKFRPFNKKTSSDKMFQTFIEFVIKKFKISQQLNKSLLYIKLLKKILKSLLTKNLVLKFEKF